MRSWPSRLSGVVLLTAGIGACDAPNPAATVPPPPEGFRYSTATPDCAPWDGPAIAIHLASAPGSDSAGIAETTRPLLRVVIYPRGQGIAGKTYQWPSDPEVAAGYRCLTGDACDAATSGEVMLLPAPGDTVFEGSLRLHFQDGTTISGGFHATWHDRRMMCG